MISFPLHVGSKRAARQQALKYAARAHRIFEAPECEENSSWCKRSIIGLLQSGEEKVLLVEDNAAFDSAADVPDFEISTGLLSNSGGVAGGPMLMDAIAAYRADLAMRQGEAGNSNIANLESGPFSLPPDSCAPRQKSSRAGGVRPRRRRWWKMSGKAIGNGYDYLFHLLGGGVKGCQDLHCCLSPSLVSWVGFCLFPSIGADDRRPWRSRRYGKRASGSLHGAPGGQRPPPSGS